MNRATTSPNSFLRTLRSLRPILFGYGAAARFLAPVVFVAPELFQKPALLQIIHKAIVVDIFGFSSDRDAAFAGEVRRVGDGIV